MTSVPVRSLTTNGVGTAAGLDVEALDVVGVHRDVGDVAEQAHALPVGRHVDVLGDVAAVEQQRVGTVLALDHVAAVAGVPLERVVAGAEERPVVTLVAVDDVVADAAEQDVGAVAAAERVVVRAAVDRDADEGGQVPGRREAVGRHRWR